MMGCVVKPQPIRYGEAGCHSCKMTIVDKRYATQIVTSKGKAYSFDAVECMINFMLEGGVSIDEKTLLLTNVFSGKEELFPVSEVVFLRSPDLPSPMGMFLTPFKKESHLIDSLNQRENKIYQWDELVKDFTNLPVLKEP